MSGQLATVLVGLAAGMLSGAFGVGGGVVTTPAIRLVLGYPALIAVGTPLPVIIPTAIAGVWSYHRSGLVDVRVGAMIGLAGFPLTLLGAWFSSQVGGTLVLLVTAALIAYMVFDIIIGARREAHASSEASAPGILLLGAAAGLYSGFLGLGGGFVIVPALTRFARMPLKRAIGTSLLAVSLLAVPGTIAHWYLGNVDLGLAGTLAIGVVPGALLGARFTRSAAERSVRYAFAALLTVTALVLVSNEIGLLG